MESVWTGENQFWCCFFDGWTIGRKALLIKDLCSGKKIIPDLPVFVLSIPSVAPRGAGRCFGKDPCDETGERKISPVWLLNAARKWERSHPSGIMLLLGFGAVASPFILVLLKAAACWGKSRRGSCAACGLKQQMHLLPLSCLACLWGGRNRESLWISVKHSWSSLSRSAAIITRLLKRL